jgi:hypothetical protein
MFNTSTATVPVRLGSTPDDYARIGIAPRNIKPWEDGMRTGGARGTFEWWYFDAHLDDGAKLVVVFSRPGSSATSTSHSARASESI